MFILLYRDFNQQQFLQINENLNIEKTNTLHQTHTFNEPVFAYDFLDTDHDDHHTNDSNILPLIKNKEWGQTYSPVRVICMVPTLWPKKKYTMKAIAITWGAYCDHLFFVLDNAMAMHTPDTFYNATMLKLNLEHRQSSGDRNIWEKVWKMFYHMGKHHLYDAEWFLKIDDDSFFSAVNFRGFTQYFNPDGEWYMGHTLLHSWSYKNVVFNSGTCYALSRGSLRKLYPIFSTSEFQNDNQRKHSKNYCVHRSGDQEDPTIGLCLRSIGINPTNTLDNDFRERFHTFRPRDHRKIPRENTWFWRYKHLNVGFGDNCCSPNAISFHNYKKNPMREMKELNEMYNDRYINNGNVKQLKVFEIPNEGRTFLYDNKSAPVHDQWLNAKYVPRGQRIFKGIGNERFCHACESYAIKSDGMVRGNFDYYYNLKYGFAEANSRKKKQSN